MIKLLFSLFVGNVICGNFSSAEKKYIMLGQYLGSYGDTELAKSILSFRLDKIELSTA